MHLVGGFPVRAWVDMFFHVHVFQEAWVRLEWPDGGAYLDQPNLAVEVFDVIRDEAIDRMNEKRKKDKDGKRHSVHRPR